MPDIEVAIRVRVDPRYLERFRTDLQTLCSEFENRVCDALSFHDGVDHGVRMDTKVTIIEQEQRS